MPTTSRRGNALSAASVQVALVVGLVLVAAVLRWPHLWNIPLWTDEGGEVQVAVWIYRDGAFPLTNENAYNGPLFNYILAGFFSVLGMGAFTPRIMVLVLGALTAVPTFLLARELGRGSVLAGVVAAALLAVNAVHIAVNSHVSWGNCITPLFTTTACWLLARAFRRPRETVHGDDDGDRFGGARQSFSGKAIRASPHPSPLPEGEGIMAQASLRCRDAPNGLFVLLAALTFGLALQTHPTVFALIAGAGVFALWKGRALLRTPWPYLGVVAFAIGVAPMIANQLRGGGLVWLSAAQRKQAIYNTGESLEAAAVIDRLLRLVQTLGASLAGLLNDRDTPFPDTWHPAILLASGLATVSVVWLWRRGQPLPGVLCLVGIVALALVHGKYAPIISSARYVGFLVPILLASIGALVAGLWDEFRAARASGPGWAGARFFPAAACALSMGIASLASLFVFYADAQRDGRTNEKLIASYQALRADYRPGDTVAIDRRMFRDWTLTEGRLQRVLAFWLELDSIPHSMVEVLPDGRFSGGLTDAGGLAILATANLPVVESAYALTIIDAHAAPASPQDRGYVVARASPRR